MDNNLTLILKEFESLKGQFVITESYKIARLVAVGEDMHDYYYVTYDGRKFTWNTCVGRIMPLKGYLREEDYTDLVRSANLNHFDQVASFGNDSTKGGEIITVHKNMLITTATNQGDQFLTEICWDLN